MMSVIKGREIKVVFAKDSFDRRALQYVNKILYTLRKIGVTEDYVDLQLEKVAIKKATASVSFYIEGNHLHFSYHSAGRYVDNLYVISKILELEVDDLLNEIITQNDFIAKFSEEKDIKKERKEARETLGLDAETMDIDLVNKQYKALAKECHPDTLGSDMERFKAINRAHKILKREIEA